MFDGHLIGKAKHLLEVCERNGVMIATAESCTGGLVSALLTEIPGSSSVFERGFITYSNDAKKSLLSVPDELIVDFGAVSYEVVASMALGALANSAAQLSIAVTGIAGPSGGTAAKPVGLVYIAIALKGAEPSVEQCHFSGSRSEIRFAAVAKAIELAQEAITHRKIL